MSDPDETLSADEGEPGDQHSTGGPHVQPRQLVSQAAVQVALPIGVSDFTFDFDSGIMLQDEDGLVGVSHHEQQVGVTEDGEGVADPLSGSTNETRRRRLSKREHKVEEKEKMCQKFRDALAAWNTGRYVSMRQCAEAFGVPRTSLNDMIREGRTEWRGKGGKSKVFIVEEELIMTKHIVDRLELGVGLILPQIYSPNILNVVFRTDNTSF